MRFVRRTRRFFAWMASMVILLSALMPSVTAAVQSQDRDAWFQICSASGASWLNADAAEPAHPGGAHAALGDHCPFCTLQHHPFTVPVVPVLGLTGVAGRVLEPLLSLHAPPTPLVWSSVQPRAPPVLG